MHQLNAKRSIIQRTLHYLGVNNASTELFALLLLSHFEMVEEGAGHGPFQLSLQQHRQLWDNYLAFRPEQASQVRGLASQRHFLQDPEFDLSANLAYSVAILWVELSARAIVPSACPTQESLWDLWQAYFSSTDYHPHYTRVDFERAQNNLTPGNTNFVNHMAPTLLHAA